MSMALKKEVLLMQNLQLLGFPAAEAGPQHGVRTAEAMAKPVLHANMFDRPNEKVLFQVLHFLLVKMNPQVEQEMRFCWPVVTPHDKTNFKKLVQSVLQDMEKSNMLPLGSSQASRLNTGYGPRTVDLIWRLSTQALKTALTRDTAGYQFVAPRSKDQAETQEAIQLLKAKIAMKTRQFQEDCVARSRIQDEWAAFATALTQKIQEVTKLLEETYEKQSKLDASVDRGFYSQAGDVQRTTKLQNISTSWETIHGSMTSRAYQSNRAVLDTTLHHHGDQPVLDAHQLRPQRSFSDRHGAVNLVDVVKNADALIQLVRRRLAQQDSTQILSDRDTSRLSAVTRESNAYIANLTTMTQQLRQLLVQIKTTNESNARDL
ncbi:hypothetical protein Poli38472_008624 [Pythium oligandrum]|uniref:HAUS augmin-like complex subunit 6 N-terminal domain-containing protein n=1 Tax=Pythium oligandrum TaxID=41045 RepID=A0A8K1C3W4_PYTOL|nr:hypothetical protein Poli38472_008624 [Pythium oligandrum]|eukprot:TMW55976.1 hypothetical protein Poli38472_008624 [Pythium oligandrum]